MTLCIVVTWIMTQRILIHLRGIFPFNFSHCTRDSHIIPPDAAENHNRGMTEATTCPLSSPRAVSRAMREQFEHKSLTPTRDGGPDSRSVSDLAHGALELDVHVRVEHNVTVEYNPGARQYDYDCARARAWQDASWRGDKKDPERERDAALDMA